MGVDRWAYLGPYVEIPLTLKTTRQDLCAQPSACPNPTEGQFCPTCGIQVARRFHEFQSADPPLPDFLWEELDEALMLAGDPGRINDQHVIYRLVGNQKRPGALRSFHMEGSSDLCLDLSVLDQEAEIKWFKGAFGPEWMKLQKTYGGLTFKWGYLQWFS